MEQETPVTPEAPAPIVTGSPTEVERVELESARDRVVESVKAKLAALSQGSATDGEPESATAEAAPAEQTVSAPAQASPYTPEELTEFAERGGLDAHDLDKTRVPAEVMALWKRLDRHFKVKLQTLAQPRDDKGKFTPQPTAKEVNSSEYEDAIELLNDPERRQEGVKSLLKTSGGREAVKEILQELGLPTDKIRQQVEQATTAEGISLAVKGVPELANDAFLGKALDVIEGDARLAPMLQGSEQDIAFALRVAALEVKASPSYIAEAAKTSEAAKAKEKAEEAKRLKEAANRTTPGSKAAASVRKGSISTDSFKDKLRASVTRNLEAAQRRR